MPNYSSKGKSVFYYRLVGLDKEWQSTQSEKSVSYSSLTPGTYRFEMYSTNKNSKRSPDILAIDITISNPWYASLVAKLLYLIALISGVVFFIKVKNNIKIKSLPCGRLFLFNLSNIVRRSLINEIVKPVREE